MPIRTVLWVPNGTPIMDVVPAGRGPPPGPADLGVLACQIGLGDGAGAGGGQHARPYASRQECSSRCS